MSDIRGYPFRLKLSLSELKILHKISMDQLKRWDKIIESEAEDSLAVEDYQYDSLHLNNMLDDLEKHLSNTNYDHEVSFSNFQTRILIESIDYELEAWKKGRSNFTPEEFYILNQMLTPLKKKAIEEFGENALKPLRE